MKRSSPALCAATAAKVPADLRCRPGLYVFWLFLGDVRRGCPPGAGGGHSGVYHGLGCPAGIGDEPPFGLLWLLCGGIKPLQRGSSPAPGRAACFFGAPLPAAHLYPALYHPLPLPGGLCPAAGSRPAPFSGLRGRQGDAGPACSEFNRGGGGAAGAGGRQR